MATIPCLRPFAKDAHRYLSGGACLGKVDAPLRYGFVDVARNAVALFVRRRQRHDRCPSFRRHVGEGLQMGHNRRPLVLGHHAQGIDSGLDIGVDWARSTAARCALRSCRRYPVRLIARRPTERSSRSFADCRTGQDQHLRTSGSESWPLMPQEFGFGHLCP